MILKKLYIHNYKSFYDTTIEFDKFNIIIGENNSGKSNIIDVLEFINTCSKKDFDEAIREKGGFEKILNYNYTESKIFIELELEIQLEDNLFLFKFRLTIEKEKTINSLIIYIKLNNKLIPLHLNASKYNKTLNKMGSKIYSYTENITKFNLSKELMLLQLSFFNILSSLSQTYAFDTQEIRDNSHKQAIKELEKNGSNLGKTLFKIKKNYLNSFEIISNSMIGIVNEIDGIDIEEIFENYIIGFNEKNKQIGIDTVSDGTINLLATMTALNQNDNKSILLAFDEPERYLHLKAINYILELFRADKKQILITTHSTEILKNANLNEIIFLYRDKNGDTQSIKASNIPDLKGKLERLGYDRPLSLDELISDGIIGNF